MTYEKAFLPKAERGKFLRSTNRKETNVYKDKTTFKRIALVAVAALGFGVLTSVAPATAVNGQVASAITIGSATSFRTGAVNVIPITVTFPSGSAANDTTTVTVQITSAPSTGGNANAASVLGSGSAADSNSATTPTDGTGKVLYFAADANGTALSGSALQALAAAGTTNSTATTLADGKGSAGQREGNGLTRGVAGNVAAAAISVAATAAGVTTKTVYLVMTPDLSGSYTILVGSNAVGRTVYAAGDTSATATFATTGAVASVTLSALNTSPIGANPFGVIVKAVLKDSAGLGTTLGSLDSIQLTSSDTNDTFTHCAAADGNCVATITNGTLTRAMFTNGVGFFKVTNSGAASTISTITATGSGTLPNTVTSTVAATFKKLTDLGDAAQNTVTVGKAATTGYDGTITAGSTSTLNVSSSATSSALKLTYATDATTVAALAALTSSGSGYVTVTDTNKKIFGAEAQAPIVYTPVYSIGAAATSSTVTISHAALGTSSNTYLVTLPAPSTSIVGATATTAVTMTGASGGSRGTNVLTATPAGPVAAAAKGKITISANLVNRYGVAIASAPVTATVAGRNTVSSTALVTDADGNVTFSYTDAGTTATNDVVTFTNASSSDANATATVTVSYSTAAVSTVTVTGGDTTASVANATVSVKPISAGDGAELGEVAIVATVKDANGSLLLGVPVTFTVAGTGVAIPTNEVTVYTGSAGTATSGVYAWVAGTYTYTATAGGVSTTGKITFGSITPGNARVLSATVEGNVVTAKVVDRFGNPVKGVIVYATKSGAGYFGSGLSRTSDTTLENGTAQFGITGGDASVTVTTLDPAAAAGTNAAGQTCALAG
ncbi:MAG: hypothetical protein EBU08_12535, partial [Micrococcales bacterium]|nr:hypothetical protein [Micrococcales bacterium]